MTTRYDNTPTVVVARVPLAGGLLMIRRALPGLGQGQLALPGGYQMLGQTWQEAGAREVFEETGVAVDPVALRLLTVVTTTDTRQNLLFCESPPVEHDGPFVHDAEVSDVLVVRAPVQTAFPLHTAMVADFFAPADGRGDDPKPGLPDQDRPTRCIDRANPGVAPSRTPERDDQP